MKQLFILPKARFAWRIFLAGCLPFIPSATDAQDSSGTASGKIAVAKPKPVKNTFQSVWLIDAQTVMVPVKGTFEMDIQHRFGTVQNGYKDLWGIYGSSNIRLGFAYAPISNLYVGFGLTKNNLLWDGSAKYAILKQTKGLYPVSVTYYGNIAYKSIEDPNHVLFTYNTQRLSYFNELIIARKVTDRLSVQASIGVSHQNSVPGYYSTYDSASKIIFREAKFDMFSASMCLRYKLTQSTSFIINYEQPLSSFPINNPHPNVAFGFDFNTSGHSFQVFAGNYSLLNPQQNSLYNGNNPFGYTDNGGVKVPGGVFEIGFNITRLWNF